MGLQYPVLLLRNINSNVKTRATTNVCLHVPTFCYQAQHNQRLYTSSEREMPSWDVVNGAPLQWKLAEGGLSRLVYIIESVRLFVCLFVRGKRQNYGTD